MFLKLFRKYVKVFLWTIAVLIIPSFILWGVGSGIQSHRRSQEAGRIFRHRVTWDDYETALRSTEMLLSFSNIRPSPFLDPAELAWDRLIMLHEVKRRNIPIPDQEVIEYIRTIPAFRSSEGEAGKERFDMKRYEEILYRAFHLTPQAFEQEMRKTLLLSKLRDQIMAEVFLDDKTLREAYKQSHDKRKVSYIEFARRDFEKDVSVTEEILLAYYESHKGLFERPEERRVAFLTADFEKRTPEEAKQLMEKVLEELLAGKDLEEAGKTNGLALQETGFFALGDPPPGPDFSYELMQEAFLRDPGAVSDAVETKTGVAILKVLEKRPPHPLSFEEARERAEKMVRAEKAEELCRQKAEVTSKEIQKKMGEENVPWEEAVRSLGFSLAESPFFAQDGYVEKIGNAPLFTQAAFSLPLKEIGSAVNIPNGTILFRVEAEEPFKEEDFLKEKEAFRERVAKQKRSEHYLEWFQALRTQAELTSNVEASR